ncbi:hypothetical protein AOQ84DRAFT_420939 [Glonium stellatum]|uniref:EthD domain-containing protein n=1 Tax=Glonium stellatum TaxID=574774 RepID=A0A8E2ERD1_9PEZI|nr:hypothetical protein AOQ84DRAFT_420939 [Glonium stellatum]
MPYEVLLLCSRIPSITPAEFKSYFESKHIPLLQSLSGPYFPTTHTRHYIQRPEGDDYRATVMVGEGFEYDAVCEMSWENEAAFKQYFERVMEPEAAKRISDDDQNFVDRSSTKVVILGETRITTR